MVVLVIESSAILIERWKLILTETENIGLVYGAVSFKDALKLFKEIHPRVVLLDSALPGNRSIELVMKVKESGLQTTVIIMSNLTDEHLKNEFISTGADFFFDKYFEFEKITETVMWISKN